MDGCGCVKKVRLDMSAKCRTHVCSTIPFESLYQVRFSVIPFQH